jgi:hypothetical protein
MLLWLCVSPRVQRSCSGHFSNAGRCPGAILKGTTKCLSNSETPGSRDHIAFKVSKETLEATAQKLEALQLEHIRARGSSSLYFFDYDNHVFELDTATLEEELKTEA